MANRQMNHSLWALVCLWAVVQCCDAFQPSVGWRTLPSTRLLSSNKDEDREYAYVKRKRGRRDYDDDQEEEDQDERNYDTKDYYDEDDDEEEEDWDSDWDDEAEDYELLGNVLIPNPILDAMDPDGTAERFPELAKDPRFWFDMFLFITFLDFLSTVGPRDPFPDIPWV
jgi:hypothetical protein